MSDQPVGKVTTGIYSRYGIKKHEHLLAVFPHLIEAMILRDTYEEASEAARTRVMKAVPPMMPITVVHHPHKESSADPLELFGSWGVRWPEPLEATGDGLDSSRSISIETGSADTQNSKPVES